MKKNADGYFLLDERMPCKPRNIVCKKWFLPNVSGGPVLGEAAARIIYYSQEYNKWVAVSWICLQQMLIEEYIQEERSQGQLAGLIKESVSSAFLFGTQCFSIGVKELIGRGFVQGWIENEGGKPVYAFGPTSALIAHVMKMQNIRAL